jgi:serine/threonine-protein kinase HipA
MTRCPITYELCPEGQKYSPRGLRLVSRELKQLHDFPYTPKEQIQLATELATKLSIQGVQPKLSVRLNVKEEQFIIVSKRGQYILKPPHQVYDEVPQNEDLTMRLAKTVGIDIPFHGMIYNKDGSLSYLIKRFDRSGAKKFAVEDFSQLLGYSRETKYESCMEKIITVLDTHCFFPDLEKLKLFRLVLFNFLIGNEDMHVKNFSLIHHHDKVELSPAYDLLNTTILIDAREEIALPIRGKKSRLTYDDLVVYFGGERLKLQPKVLENEFEKFKQVLEQWKQMLEESFLSKKMQERYAALIKERWTRLTGGL